MNKFKAQLVFRLLMQLILSFCINVGHSHLFSLSLRLSMYIYIKTNIRSFFFNRIIMENLTKEISELLQQIRQVENEHNQLVDEYFKISK